MPILNPSNQIISGSIKDPYNWPGILPTTQLTNKYADKLRSISSPVPESYRSMMLESNYHMDQNAVMMLPGMTPELVAMGFQMSAATPIR